jgi:hypothetical protein
MRTVSIGVVLGMVLALGVGPGVARADRAATSASGAVQVARPPAHPPLSGVCKIHPAIGRHCIARWDGCMGRSGGDAQLCLPGWRGCCTPTNRP